MAKDVSLGGFLLTREEWEALDENERLMLMGAVVEPSSGGSFEMPESYYESYEVIFEEKLAS